MAGLQRPGLISVRNHHLLAAALGPETVVLDLGAHLGEFSLELRRKFGCRCHAIEANPELCERIPAGDGLEKLHCAVSQSDGPVSFTIDANLEGSHLTSDGRPGPSMLTVPGYRIQSIQEKLGLAKIDLLKIDVEGAEFAVFDSMSDAELTAIPQVTVEFHDFIEALNCKARVLAIERRMKALGFACIVFSRSNYGDVLFVNRRHHRASAFEWFYLERMARYVHGIRRVVVRSLC